MDGPKGSSFCSSLNPSVSNTVFNWYAACSSPYISLLAYKQISDMTSLILVGIVVSYIPQYHRIINRGSAYGISPYYTFLGFASITFALSTLILVSYNVLQCYHEHRLHGVKAFGSLMGPFQIGTHWLCLLVFHALDLRYSLFYSLPPAPSSDSSNLSKRTSPLTIAIGLTSLFVALVVLVPTLLIGTSPRGQTPQDEILLVIFFIVVLFVFNLLSLIQYIPQIRLTYTLKQTESLSILSLALQMLVYGLLAVSLAQNLASVNGKASLISSVSAFFFRGRCLVLQYGLAAMFSGLLLGIGLYYEYVCPGGHRDAAFSGDEQTLLLGESG